MRYSGICIAYSYDKIEDCLRIALLVPWHVQLPIHRVLGVAHLCQSDKVQGALAELENLADKVLAGEPAVTEHILGTQTLVSPCAP